jgi:hypothetical protein
MKRGEEGQRKRGGEYMYEEDGTQIKKTRKEKGKREDHSRCAKEP